MATASKWLVLDLYSYYDGNDKVIVAITDVPCHLFMRYQDTGIVLHRRIKIMRGVPMTRDPHLGFDNWLSVEQQQEGDTLEHWFAIPDFQPCQTWYWQFSGTINGQESPSLSPVFKQHRPLPTDKPWTGYFGYTGWTSSDLTLFAPAAWGSCYFPEEDCYPIDIGFRIGNEGGNFEAIKFAIYEVGPDNAHVITTTEWGEVPPLTEDVFYLDCTSYPKLVEGQLYTVVWFVSAPTLRRFWHAGPAYLARVKMMPWGYWPPVVDFGRNGWGSACVVRYSLVDPADP